MRAAKRARAQVRKAKKAIVKAKHAAAKAKKASKTFRILRAHGKNVPAKAMTKARASLKRAQQAAKRATAQATISTKKAKTAAARAQKRAAAIKQARRSVRRANATLQKNGVARKNAKVLDTRAALLAAKEALEMAHKNGETKKELLKLVDHVNKATAAFQKAYGIKKTAQKTVQKTHKAFPRTARKTTLALKAVGARLKKAVIKLRGARKVVKAVNKIATRTHHRVEHAQAQLRAIAKASEHQQTPRFARLSAAVQRAYRKSKKVAAAVRATARRLTRAAKEVKRAAVRSRQARHGIKTLKLRLQKLGGQKAVKSAFAAPPMCVQGMRNIKCVQVTDKRVMRVLAKLGKATQIKVIDSYINYPLIITTRTLLITKFWTDFYSVAPSGSLRRPPRRFVAPAAPSAGPSSSSRPSKKPSLRRCTLKRLPSASSRPAACTPRPKKFTRAPCAVPAWPRTTSRWLAAY
jgi:hypothetical protein